MAERHFILNASTHVDLAWKWDRAEMSEMLEAVVIRLLDALESNPDFKYTIEQCAHYRALAERRPDLVERLRPFLQQGRLEMAGCMASTLETNLPSGESFVRNQLLGLKWARQTWGYAPKSGWLIDTFGINAQVPQILRQFGIKYLSANRLGGDKFDSVMFARGLDGTQTLVVGQDVYSPFVKPEHLAISCYSSWKQIDALFAEADRLTGPGPFMVFAQTENEMLVSLRPLEHVRRRQQTRPHERWEVGTAIDYFLAVERSSQKIPVTDADMNPEFTGCFSLRPKIRLRNRRAETLLLEAEKWACIAGIEGWEAAIEDAWWQMAFVQFHDVFTGSHPASVYDHVIETFDAIDAAAEQLLDRAMGSIVVEADAPGEIVLFNGLPWTRQAIVELTATNDLGTVREVRQEGRSVPFDLRDGKVHARVNVPPGGVAAVTIEHDRNVPPRASAPVDVTATTLENEYIKLELDTTIGLRRLTWKPTGAVLIEDAADLLLVQPDEGNFQIESPAGGEVVAAAGKMSLMRAPTAHSGEQVELRGEFPPMAWAGVDARLAWSIIFTLIPGRAAIDMTVKLSWKGEASRVRLRLSTRIDASGGIYEVPFGTVHRKPYGVRGTARGEWPAQRFVAIEDAAHGIALANNGAAGVEVGAGQITTSLLRAPSAKYAGMTPDETSSSHGEHAYAFTLVPYAGRWQDAGVSKLAQELNNPIRMVSGAVPVPRSFLSLDSDQVVLAAIKTPEDGTDEWVVRVFETTGQPATAVLRIAGTTDAWMSDLAEKRGDPVPIVADAIPLRLKPFEIQTLRVRVAPRAPAISPST